MIEKVLTLSTGHLPCDKPDFGRACGFKFDSGYAVFVIECEIPQWLAPVMDTALSNDCILILFDRDAAIKEEFRQYEW